MHALTVLALQCSQNTPARPLLRLQPENRGSAHWAPEEPRRADTTHLAALLTLWPRDQIDAGQALMFWEPQRRRPDSDFMEKLRKLNTVCELLISQAAVCRESRTSWEQQTLCVNVHKNKKKYPVMNPQINESLCVFFSSADDTGCAPHTEPRCLVNTSADTRTHSLACHTDVLPLVVCNHHYLTNRAEHFFHAWYKSKRAMFPLDSS